VNSKCLALVVLLALSISASAQRLGGTLRGTVQDPHGAVVPGAEVVVSSQATSVQLSTQTTSSGAYVFPQLLVGTYTVEVRARGFSKYSRSNVEVLPNQVVTADAKLAVGSTAEVVEVTSGGEVVQTTTSHWG